MKCPKCKSKMRQGAPHYEGYLAQWGCHNCGHVVPIDKGPKFSITAPHVWR